MVCRWVGVRRLQIGHGIETVYLIFYKSFELLMGLLTFWHVFEYRLLWVCKSSYQVYLFKMLWGDFIFCGRIILEEKWMCPVKYISLSNMHKYLFAKDNVHIFSFATLSFSDKHFC